MLPVRKIELELYQQSIYFGHGTHDEIFFLQRADKLRHLRPKSAKCTARPTSLAFAGDFEE